MTSMRNTLTLGFSVAVLAACGGGGSDGNTNTTTSPPPANIAPVATNDTATLTATENSNSFTLDVLSNDSDADSDTLTISAIVTQPANGQVEIADNQIRYTPNNFYAGADSFTYAITDGDQTVEGNVSITVSQSVTLQGKVVLSEAQTAQISTTVNGTQYSVSTDESGNYSLPVTFTEFQALIPVIASFNDEQSELISVLSDNQQMLNNAGEDRILEASEDHRVQVSALSSASWLLAQETNNWQPISTTGQLDDSLNNVDAGLLMNLATYLAIQEQNNAISSTEVLHNQFQNMNVLAIHNQINTLLAPDILRAKTSYLPAEYSAAYLSAQNQLIEQVLSLTDPSTILDSGVISLRPGLNHPDWLEDNANVLELNQDNTGHLYEGYYNTKSAFNWSNEEKQVDLISTETGRLNAFIWPTNGFAEEESSLEVLSFWGESVTEEFLAIMESNGGRLNASGQNFYTTKDPLRQVFSLPIGTKRSLVVIKTTEERRLDDEILARFWENGIPVAQATYAEAFNVDTTEQEILIDEIADSRWILPLLAPFEPEEGVQVNGISYEKYHLHVDFNEDEATVEGFSEPFNWQQNGNSITLTGEVDVFTVALTQKQNEAYLAHIAHWHDGAINTRLTQRAIKIQDSLNIEDFVNAVKQPLPAFLMSQDNAWNMDNWENGQRTPVGTASYVFANDNSYQIIGARYHPPIPDIFYSWVSREFVQQNNELVITILNDEDLILQQNWELLSASNNEQFYLLRRRYYGDDLNGDGILDDDEAPFPYFSFIAAFTLEDMQNWPGMLEYVQSRP